MHDITISGVFNSAWKKLRGSKLSIWSTAIVMVLLAITIAYISNKIKTQSIMLHFWLSYIFFPILLYFLLGPFYGGSLMVAIKRFRDEPVNMKTGYQYLHRYIVLGITLAIIGFLSNLVSIVINIPVIRDSIGSGLPYFDLLSGIFSLLIYAFFVLSVPLIIDKNYTIGKALSTSLVKIKSHWFRVFLIFFFAYLILFLIYIPAVLGVVLHSSLLMLFGVLFFAIIAIWFLPFLFLLGGNIYHRLIDI